MTNLTFNFADNAESVFHHPAEQLARFLKDAPDGRGNDWRLEYDANDAHRRGRKVVVDAGLRWAIKRHVSDNLYALAQDGDQRRAIMAYTDQLDFLLRVSAVAVAESADLPDAKNPSFIAKHSDIAANRATVTRMGRLYTRLTGLDSTWAQHFVESVYQPDFDPTIAQEYAIKCGMDREDFAFAYGGATLARSTGNQGNYSCLQNSCMQGVQKRLASGGYAYVGEAYASGDFAMWTATTQDGKLAARCVVSLTNGYGPIYATCKPAGLALERAMEDDGHTSYSSFYGDELLALELSSGGLLCPYMDCRTNVSYDGNAIQIDDGEEETDTSGVINGETRCECASCGDMVPEDATQYVESMDDGWNNGCVCDGCISWNFFTCEYDGELYHNDEAETVWSVSTRTVPDWTVYEYSKRWYGNGGNLVYVTRESTTEETWARCNAENEAVWIDDHCEWWTHDSLTELGCGDYVPTTYLDSGDYEKCADGIWWREGEAPEAESAD